ncbi:ABC transporter, transmembrane domain, type 1 [Akanthomyces lecanii RCEF 1005]|uniref:ABC transporter, transmembrane domain, type 1 n=1 Tax=Akanthomyces lecanii RCEF 1005 TaxID=1081108 RepID=A0A162KUX1_CORDF|nr:ABC transporter, transmembrane domain, type 1 [Akanthomyces lecanii RCEF 1005]
MSSLAQSNDSLFGPQLPGHFDFTVLFEHAMLGLIPTALVVSVTPLYLKVLLHTQRQVRPGYLLWSKLACGVALVAIQAANIMLWHKTDYFQSRVTVATSIMSLLASICTMAIIVVTHIYYLQPSSFLSLLFSLTMIFDITMARSYFLRNTLSAIAALQVSIVVLKFFLVILEEVSKRGLYLSQELRSTVSAETASGFWNRSLFVWLNPLLVFGWRNQFTIDKLPSIGEEFESERLFDRFSHHWVKANKSSRLALLLALLRTLKWQFAQVLLPRLLYIGFVIAQPFLVLRTVEAVGQEHTSRASTSGLIGACGIIYFGLAVTRTIFEHWGFRVVTSVRGILVVAVYDKTQRLSAEALDAGNAVTLMSTDVEGTEDIVSLAYESWSCIIQVAFGIWILHTFIGAACFLIILPTLATFLGSILTGKKISGARAAWNAETENRVAATSNMLAQLKSVKSMGLSGSLLKQIEHKREVEIATSLRERYSLLWVFSFGAVNFTVTPAIVFAGAYFWTRSDDPMSVAEVFAILAVLAISSNPLIDLFRSVTQWSAAFASIARIQRFLLQKDYVDPRDVPMAADVDADGEKEPRSAPRKPFAFELADVSVTSPTTGPVLREVTFRIPWASHTMMWGPINCGKSTLLKLLLGEVELNGGTISAGSRDIAYCSQETWIENTTVEKVITGTRRLIQPLYSEIVRACALDADFQQMPNGDQTQTGSGGCNLSGGQRQRLGLARSAYAQKDIMVLDDMFSSVDPETAGLIFSRLFGPQGIVRRWNCTVIMTTNRLELLDFANQIFQFSKNGRVQEQNDNESEGSSAIGESSDENSAAGDASGDQQQAGVGASDSEEAQLPSVQAKEGDNVPQPQDEGSGGDLSVYKYFLGSVGIFAILIWVFLAVIAAVGEWMPVIFLRICTATGYIQTWTAFETSFGAIRRIKLFVLGTPQEKDTLSGPPLPENWPTNGLIDFNAVSATYKTTDGVSHKALNNATVTIPAGQKIGIMGRTGSGKSTVLATILRMVEYAGSISIDGRNTRDVPRELLRSRITTITQEGLRLKATLRFNMYPFEGSRPSDDEIIDALRRVELWDHANRNGGLDAQYSTIRFTTAQKQLMFLARGILHQSTAGTKIVMIDEVTSSLTLDMERNMQRIIDQAFAGCTILLVSHRRESFLTTDFVLRFRSGQLYSMMRRRSSTGGWVEVQEF